MSTSTVPVNLLTKSIFVIPINLLNWMIWSSSILCLSCIYPVFVVSYCLLWWFNIFFGQSDCNHNIVYASTRRFKHKHFLSLPAFQMFNAKLFILSCYMIHPCYALFFAEHLNRHSYILLITARDDLVALFNPLWAIVNDNFPRYSPEGFIIEAIFFLVALAGRYKKGGEA